MKTTTCGGPIVGDYPGSSSSGMAPPEAQPLRLVPNPARNSTRLELIQDIYQPRLIQVFNASGHLVYRQKVSSGQASLELPLQGLPPGGYLVQLLHARGQATRRLLIY